MGTMAGRDEINMRTVIALIMTMVILIGCGSTKMYFLKEGVTKEQVDKDVGECNLQGMSSTAGQENPLIMMSLRKDISEACMRTRGYFQVTEDQIKLYMIDENGLIRRKSND